MHNPNLMAGQDKFFRLSKGKKLINFTYLGDVLSKKKAEYTIW